MTDTEYDMQYLDVLTISKINKLEMNKFIDITKEIIQGLNYNVSFDKLNNFSTLIQNYIGEANSLTFYRELRYLINKGVFNKISKKFKADLLELGFSQEKIDVFCDLLKNYIESFNEFNKQEEKSNLYELKDFQVKTEMPVNYTNYPIKTENIVNVTNNDMKKQNLIFNFVTTDKNKSSETEKSEKSETKNLIFEMDKTQLSSFYEEIEKIQEKLDKLY